MDDDGSKLNLDPFFLFVVYCSACWIWILSNFKLITASFFCECFTDPRNSGEFNMNHENGRKHVSENDRKRKQNEANAPKENKSQISRLIFVTKQTKQSNNNLSEANALMENRIQISKQESVTNQTKPSNSNFGPGRPSKLSLDHKANGDTKLPQQLELPGVQKKPPTFEQDVSHM